MESIYVGNLPEDITKQDIFERVGSNLTSYFSDACNIDFRL